MTEDSNAVNFVDLDSGGDACVLVRAASGAIGLTLSLRDNGDLAVFMPPDVARKLAASLNQAAAHVQGDLSHGRDT